MYFGLITPFWSAIMPIIIIAVTDKLDGEIARRFGQKTPIGDVLDVVGDRITELVYWIYFTSTGAIPYIIPALFVSRGVLVDGFVGFARSKGYNRMSFTNKGFFHFITASDFGRGASAISKLLAFMALSYGATIGLAISWLALSINLIRAIPVFYKASSEFEF